MAIRINVTAVRQCPPAELRAVMSEVIRPVCSGAECAPVGDQLDVHEHGGWTWFATSVWGVGAGDLNRGLCKLARPALQFTTSDGDRWYLTVHGGPRGQVNFLHEFGYHAHAPDPAEDAERQAQVEQREEPPPVDPRLAFLEEDRPAGPQRAPVPFDLIADSLAEMGAPVPEEFRASVTGLPYSAAVNRYRRWHADHVVAALAAAGIPHDPAAVHSVLLWETVTDNERGGDLGNLPRLLSVLGLGGEWDDCVRQAEAPPPPEPEPVPEPPQEPVAVPTPEPPDHFGPVLTIIEPLGLSPVQGGPFELPLEELTLLRFFVEALSVFDTAGVVLDVALPPDFDRARVPVPATGRVGSVERTADGFRVGLDNHLWFSKKDLKQELGKGLARLLYHLPDGAVIDVAFALAGKPALAQRYRGPVAGGRWQVRETFPPLTHEALAGGMDLARYAAGDPERHELRDEAEAAAVEERARWDPNLWDMKVQRKGRTVWCGSDVVGHLVKVIFRERFAGHWDVAAHDREATVHYQQRVDMQKGMRRAGAEAARRRAAPHDDAVLLQGRCGPYWRSDFALLDALEQETRQKTDAALACLGFTHVGDLVAKKQRDIVARAYASGDGRAYGLLLAKRTMYLGYEFVSRFADGSLLSTTTNAALESQPQLRLYARTHPGLEPAALYEKHCRGIERFRTHKGTEPVPLEATLVGVAREYDRVLARRNGVGLRIRIVAPPPGEAPANVRAAWVGCVLPLFATTDDPRVGKQGKGVLTRRSEGRPDGFAVQVVDAIEALDRHDAKAARWWREHTPGLIQPGQLFVFRGDVCALVEGDELGE
jgi:hypothetical protein